MEPVKPICWNVGGTIALPRAGFPRRLSSGSCLSLGGSHHVKLASVVADLDFTGTGFCLAKAKK